MSMVVRFWIFSESMFGAWSLKKLPVLGLESACRVDRARRQLLVDMVEGLA